jgi:subtilisin family serine protease
MSPPRPAGSSRTGVRRFAAGALAVLGCAALVVGTASARASETPAQSAARTAPAALAAGHTYTVTLLTGEVVTVHTRQSGCPTVTVRRGPAGGAVSQYCGPDGHAHVVPVAARPQLGTVLDPALFDVTALIADGLDDAHSSDTPLIVQYATTPKGTAAPDALGAQLDGRRALPRLRALAGRQPKSDAAKSAGKPGGKAQADKTPQALAAHAEGVTHIWLDRRVHLTSAALGVPAGPAGATGLDQNLSQIGAPQAWQAGATGAGVRVAVLDTGADPNHPDLAGQVVASENFTGDGEDTTDHFGHGTHVAALIAGTGAASGGARRGVAPDAKLLVGKVLGDDGFGDESWALAGMEWAAPQADIVSMSLGGDLTDGTDPLSLEVEALTRQYGTLFVIAAGNIGPSDQTLQAPGTAASALTVGAVDGTDTVAGFSSRGPLPASGPDSYGLKPEIVAPGVEIVAARAAGTTMGRPIDRRYTAASGTSMATPQVAGAAADLLGRHPGWSPAQVKAALVGAADPAHGGDVFALGAGRLDLPAALGLASAGTGGVVSAQPALELGTLRYPQSGTVAGRASWTNTGTAPVTLRVSIAVADRLGHPAPAGAVLPEASTVAVQPGQTSTLGVTVDAARFAAAPGLYQGILTATAPGGGTARTPVTFFVEPASYDLTVTAKPLPGTPSDAGSAFAFIVDIDDPELFSTAVVADGEPVRVPAGHYSVIGEVDDRTEGATRAALTGDPQVTVAGDTSVLLDASKARPVTASVDGVDTQIGAESVFVVQTPLRGDAFWFGPIAWPTSPADFLRGTVYTVPMGGVRTGTLRAYEYFNLLAPSAANPSTVYDLMPSLGDRIPADPSYRVTAAVAATLARIDQHFAQPDLLPLASGTSRTLTHNRYGLTLDGAFAAQENAEFAPGDRVDYVSPGVLWSDEAFVSPFVSDDDFGLVTQEPFRQYPAGSRQSKSWFNAPLRPDWYDSTDLSLSFCQPEPVRRTRGNLHVVLVELSDQHQRFDCLEGEPTWESTTHAVSLYRDGKLVGKVGGIRADFPIPADQATYRLRYDLDTNGLTPVSTRVTTDWTFRSAGPADNSSVALPLLSVDYALGLSAASHPGPGPATFTVRQAGGLTAQPIGSFTVQVSTDDGRTWRPVPTTPVGSDTFRANLPAAGAGSAVSLRVHAGTTAGSAVDQTIIRAYRAAGALDARNSHAN